MASGASLNKRDLLLFASLGLLELSIVVMSAALYMKGERPFNVFLSSKPGYAFLCAMAAIVIAGGVIVRQYLASQWSRSRDFYLVVAMNLVMVVLTVVMGEIAVRAGSRNHLDGEAFGNVELKPRNWETAVRRYRQIIEKASGDLSYLVYDNVMGWTVGSNRHSANGLYWSNAEGLRVPQIVEASAMVGGETEIALVGDSFTFGEEVKYEETWGYRLEQMLGPGFKVLNFGVPGYGLDQIFLRYEKDVSKRKPRIVIFGFISHDIMRSMYVYTFLAAPEWNMPFSKSRFVLRDGALTNLNAPPLPPQAIFSRGSISELPLLEYQAKYNASEWQQRPYYLSYLVRLFMSKFRPWSADDRPDVSEAAHISVNAAILKAFIRSAEHAGTIPLVAYFPTREDFTNPSSWLSLGKRVLKESGIPYIDTTPCLLEVNPTDRFLVGHYSPEGNAVVAKCLHKAVTEELMQASTG